MQENANSSDTPSSSAGADVPPEPSVRPAGPYHALRDTRAPATGVQGGGIGTSSGGTAGPSMAHVSASERRNARAAAAEEEDKVRQCGSLKNTNHLP